MEDSGRNVKSECCHHIAWGSWGSPKALENSSWSSQATIRATFCCPSSGMFGVVCVCVCAVPKVAAILGSNVLGKPGSRLDERNLVKSVISSKSKHILVCTVNSFLPLWKTSLRAAEWRTWLNSFMAKAHSCWVAASEERLWGRQVTDLKSSPSVGSQKGEGFQCPVSAKRPGPALPSKIPLSFLFHSLLHPAVRVWQASLTHKSQNGVKWPYREKGKGRSWLFLLS